MYRNDMTPDAVHFIARMTVPSSRLIYNMMYLILSLTLSHQILVHFRYSLLAWLIALLRLLLPINRLLVILIYLLHLLMITMTHSCQEMMKFLPLNICDQEQLPGVVDCLAHQRGMHLSSSRLSHDRFFLRSPFQRVDLPEGGSTVVPRSFEARRFNESPPQGGTTFFTATSQESRGPSGI
ncbi:hypothetical protein GWK47_016235 [Chionoecetes opilio]|uniref:Uncharacterized protein n=1 Tax=Chionoecetes opilio TaxID=41210 RepID=A0A8J5CKB5_CHIOP|nr:hypothetical protein GWK47_016235 [Chionoecetes opilio]